MPDRGKIALTPTPLPGGEGNSELRRRHHDFTPATVARNFPAMALVMNLAVIGVPS